MQNQKPKPSAELPPEVRRLRAFINNADDKQVARLRFATHSMAQMVWGFGWHVTSGPYEPFPKSPSASARMIRRKQKLIRTIEKDAKLPYRVLVDLATLSMKPAWQDHLSPQQREILYGPET